MRVWLEVNPSVQWDAGTDISYVWIRMIAILFKNPNTAGALPLPNILADNSSATAGFLSPFQRERNGQIFKVLMDKRCQLTLSSDTNSFPTGHGTPSRYYTWVFKINRLVTFAGNTGNPSDIVTNMFQLDIKQGDGADNDAVFTYSLLFTYIDA